MATGQSGEFHGRDAELGALAGVLERAAAGHLAIGLVEGEAGIGKTRLLTEAIASLPSARVLHAEADELERDRPFGAIADALACRTSSEDPARAQLARLITEENPSGPIERRSVTSDPGLQFRAVDAFVRMLEEEALDGPLVLVIENLHWVDPSTLLTLRSAVRQLTDHPVALLTSARPLPRTPEMQPFLDALDAAGATKVELGPLLEHDVTALVTDILGAEPGTKLLDEVAGTGGNPLFITELIAALVQEGSIRFTDGRAELPSVALPPSLRLTILRRISYLPADTLDALRAASLLGARFTLADLSVITGRSPDETYSALRDALGAGVLEEDNDKLRFRHDLIRDALYDDIPKSARSALHRDAAIKLSTRGAPSVQVAEQVVRGARPGDAEAVGLIVRAAREAGPRSPAVAARLLERAMDIASPADRERLRVEAFPHLSWSGRIREAGERCRDLLSRPQAPEVSGALWSLLFLSLMGQGRVPEAARAAQDALEVDLPDAQRAFLLSAAAHAQMLTGDNATALTMAREGLEIAEKVGDQLSAATAITGIAMTTNIAGGFTEAARLIAEAVRIGDRSDGLMVHRFQLCAFQGLLLIDVDDLPGAVTALRRGIQISGQLGTRWTLTMHHYGLVLAHFLIGEWDDAIAEFETGLTLSDETETRHALILARAIRSMIALHRDERKTAQELADLAEEELAETGPQYRWDWAPLARALLLEAEGRFGEAAATMRGVWDACIAADIHSELPVLGPELVRLSLLAGDESSSDEVPKILAELSSREDAPWLTGAALRSEGLISGNPDMLLASVEAYRASPRILDRAHACEDAARSLVSQGKTEDARRLLAEALDLYATLGAIRDEARAAAALRAHGGRRGARGARKRPTTGWESLTASEQRVVALVAEGLTNPQIGERLFISPRTVQTHISHVFTKLGVSSRAQLAAEAARRPTES